MVATPSAVTAYVSLGSNLGDRGAYLARALRRLAQTPGVYLEKVSTVYDTPPVGFTAQPRFLNAVARVRTSLNAGAFFQRLLEIEKTLGRKRDRKWGPRTIDLDLLLFGNRRIQSPSLQVPHPRMKRRAFVQIPLAEVHRAH